MENQAFSLDLDNIAGLKTFHTRLSKRESISEVHVIGWPKKDHLPLLKTQLKMFRKKKPFITKLTIHGHRHIILLNHFKCKLLELVTSAMEVCNLRKLSMLENKVLKKFLKSKIKPCEKIKITLHFNKIGDNILKYARALNALRYAKDIELELVFPNEFQRIYSAALSKVEVNLMKKLHCSKLSLIEVPESKRFKQWQLLVINLKVTVLNIRLVDITKHLKEYFNILKVVPKVTLVCPSFQLNQTEGRDIYLMLYSKKLTNRVLFRYEKAVYVLNGMTLRALCRAQAMFNFIWRYTSATRILPALIPQAQGYVYYLMAQNK